jgi:hypothetical protein
MIMNDTRVKDMEGGGHVTFQGTGPAYTWRDRNITMSLSLDNPAEIRKETAEFKTLIIGVR